MQLKKQITKTLHIRPNGRSADYITPNFIYGCAGGCRNSYCYVMRNNYDNIYLNQNIDKILEVVDRHVNSLVFPKIPNQTDELCYTYDIGCSTDVILHWKHYNWLQVFDFFKNSIKAKATFATKYVNQKLLDYNPKYKVRIRFSIMPQKVSSILEPKTSSIIERIRAVDLFYQAGYDVHLNFSPIVVYQDWLNDYKELFDLINENVKSKDIVFAEGIFLTHNEFQHIRNLEQNNNASENIIWAPQIQENKISQYGGSAVRYKTPLKKSFIDNWQELHKEIIPWNKIRYLF